MINEIPLKTQYDYIFSLFFTCLIEKFIISLQKNLINCLTLYPK